MGKTTLVKWTKGMGGVAGAREKGPRLQRTAVIWDRGWATGDERDRGKSRTGSEPSRVTGEHFSGKGHFSGTWELRYQLQTGV